MRALAVVIGLTLALAPTAATAEDKTGFAMDFTIGGGLHTGEVADHATMKTMAMRMGAGVMRGPNALLLSFSFGMLSDLAEAGASTPLPTSFLELGVEPWDPLESTCRHASLSIL